MTIDVVKEIISKSLNIPISKIKPKSHLLHNLNADSLDLYQIAMDIEAEYGFEFTHKDIAKFKQVRDIVNIIDKKLNFDQN